MKKIRKFMKPRKKRKLQKKPIANWTPMLKKNLKQ